MSKLCCIILLCNTLLQTRAQQTHKQTQIHIQTHDKITRLLNTMTKIGIYENLDTWLQKSISWQQEADSYMDIIYGKIDGDILEASQKLNTLYYNVNMLF